MTTYELAQYSWNDREVITITSTDGTLIGTFPFTFVETGGINTWLYIYGVVLELVGPEVQGELTDREGLPVALDAEPLPGKYVLHRMGEARMYLLCYLADYA